MGDTVTQCPNCETSFRVSPEQLEVADGRVRCGQCMHVFTALDHASHPQQSSAVSSGFGADGAEPDPWRGVSEEPVEAVQAELKQADDGIELGEDEFSSDELSDGEFDDAELGGDESGAVSLEDEQLDDDELLFDDLGPRKEKDVVAEELLRRSAMRDSEFDASFFDSLNDTDLVEDGKEDRLPMPPLARHEEDDDSDPALWDEPPVPQRDQDSDTRWAMELIDDLHQDKESGELPTTVATGGRGYGPAARTIVDDFSLDEHTELDSFNVGGHIDRQLDNLGGFADDYGQPDAGYSDFDAARRGGWFWALGTLLLTLLLGAQFLVFNFNTLATDNRFRPTLARVCAALPCEIPVLENLQKISFEKLVVRSHPDKTRNNALIVDVIVTNRAKFAQPFPALQLTFSDLREKVVAKQIFYPSEYLHGELSGLTLMPSKNPIHLELDIEDPGPDAINYKLKLVRGYD